MCTCVLDEIVRYTRKRVELEKKMFRKLPEREHPLHRLSPKILQHVQERRVGIVAEYKRASPAKVINLQLSVKEFYEKTTGLVIGYSVLTEPRWFLGSYTFLEELRELAVDKPILMKDFIVDPWQIELAHALGADVVLLIVRVLGIDKLDLYVDHARALGLDVIVEVDNLEDARRVAECYSGTGIILGVNSRNLATLDVDVSRACKIIEEVDFKGPIMVESGIKSREDITLIRRTGRVGAVLVGTAIMQRLDLLRELYEAATS